MSSERAGAAAPRRERVVLRRGMFIYLRVVGGGVGKSYFLSSEPLKIYRLRLKILLLFLFSFSASLKKNIKKKECFVVMSLAA
jgi:hypothetical protein